MINIFIVISILFFISWIYERANTQGSYYIFYVTQHNQI